MLLIFCFLGGRAFLYQTKIPNLYQSKRESKDQEFIQSSTTLNTGHHMGKKDKSTRTIPYKGANMLSLSQQVTTRLQLKYITEGNDKHKNHHLGTVSKKITGEL